MSVKIPCELPREVLLEQARELMPWRKGPWQIGELFIDSEWRSDVKISILRDELAQIAGKRVADIGCNNGYYMFKMLDYSPREVVGFDPSERCKRQFEWLNSFARAPLIFEQKTAAELPEYAAQHGKFDVIFCLGVIYHRSDPIALLKQLKLSLAPGGVAIIDSLIIDAPGPFALCPPGSYAGMSNAYFIPSAQALAAWSERAKFSACELIAERETTTEEQRKTEWIAGHSLGDFLAPDGRTKEGYPPPKRGYFKLSL